jgi:hypothetical protein
MSTSEHGETLSDNTASEPEERQPMNSEVIKAMEIEAYKADMLRSGPKKECGTSEEQHKASEIYTNWIRCIGDMARESNANVRGALRTLADTGSSLELDEALALWNDRNIRIQRNYIPEVALIHPLHNVYDQEDLRLDALEGEDWQLAVALKKACEKGFFFCCWELFRSTSVAPLPARTLTMGRIGSLGNRCTKHSILPTIPTGIVLERTRSERILPKNGV